MQKKNMKEFNNNIILFAHHTSHTKKKVGRQVESDTKNTLTIIHNNNIDRKKNDTKVTRVVKYAIYTKCIANRCCVFFFKLYFIIIIY